MSLLTRQTCQLAMRQAGRPSVFGQHQQQACVPSSASQWLESHSFRIDITRGCSKMPAFLHTFTIFHHLCCILKCAMFIHVPSSSGRVKHSSYIWSKGTALSWQHEESALQPWVSNVGKLDSPKQKPKTAGTHFHKRRVGLHSYGPSMQQGRLFR